MKLRPSVFLAGVIIASSAWLVFYAQGTLARESARRMDQQVARRSFTGALPGFLSNFERFEDEKVTVIVLLKRTATAALTPSGGPSLKITAGRPHGCH